MDLYSFYGILEEICMLQDTVLLFAVLLVSWEVIAVLYHILFVTSCSWMGDV